MKWVLSILGAVAVGGLVCSVQLIQRVHRLERKVAGLLEVQQDLIKIVGEGQRSDAGLMAEMVLMMKGQSLEEVKKGLSPEEGRKLEELLGK